jgi:PAS domain S-box-containing protein
MRLEKMRDNQKTKDELLQEVKTLCNRVAKLTTKDGTVQLSNQKWYSLLKNTPDIVMIVDRDGTIRFINHTEPGLKQKETIGKKVYDYIQPEHYDTMKKDLEKVFLTGHSASHEISRMKRKGELSWYQAELGPIKQDGNIVAASIISRDITEHRRTEEALKKSEENYRILVENQTDMVVKFDPEGTLLFASPSYCKTFGKSQEELTGSKFMPLIHEEDREKVTETLKKVYKPPYTGYVEERALTIDGWRWQAWLNTAILNNEKKVEAIVGVGRDITEHKQAERILRESEERYRALFQGAAEGIIVADTETKMFKYVNPAICTMLGYTEDELKKMGVRNIHPTEDLEYIISEFEAQARGEKTLTSNIPCLRKDGTIIYADIKTTNLPIDGRECNVGFFTDTTERKKAKEEIEKFKEMADHATFGCAMSDLKGNLTYLNDSFAAMHGYTPAELVGKNLKIFHTDAQMKYVRPLIKRLREKGEGLENEEVWHVHRDGTEFPTMMNNWVLKDSNGNPYQMCATAYNVTEQRRLEQTLRESEEKYRTVVESAGESIAMFDNKGKFLFVNEKGANQLGRKPRDFIGKTMQDFFPKKFADRQTGATRKVISTGQEIREISLTELRGRPRWFNTTIVPLRNSEGNITAALVMARDIHEQKKAEEALNEYREKMVRAEHLAQLGTLSSIVAHQFAQPLTTTQLSMDNAMAKLQKGASKAAVTKKLQDGLTAISRLTSILRTFQMHAGISFEKNPSQVNLKAVAERIFMLLKENARRAKVNLYVKDLDKLPTIYSYEKDLEHMFFALVENAIQAASGKKISRLVISGVMKDKQIELRFRDTCGGITKKNIDKIFEPFFTTKPLSERTGLGLYTVELLVSRTGGKIRVESKRGKGSTFVVSLPVNADAIS